MELRLKLASTALLCVLLLACGTPGAPRPPSLELPRPPDDFTAVRKGDKVTLTWTPSNENTDGTLVRRAGVTRICCAVNDFPMTTCVQAVAQVSAAPAALASQRPAKVSYTDRILPEVEPPNPNAFATYAVEVLNNRGRGAGLSNQVRVPLAPTALAPTVLKAEVTPEGIKVSGSADQGSFPWNLQLEYHLFRRAEDSTADIDLGPMLDFVAGRGHFLQFLDRSVEWDKTYYYHVAPLVTVTENGKQVAQFQGDDSPEIKVLVKDTFPPAQPIGVQAVFSGVGQKPFIDLTWASNQEPDLAGYNVYRRENGGEWTRINHDLVKAPAFRDNDVAPGHTYFYSVSAVDLRGNESPKSEPASESVPPE